MWPKKKSSPSIPTLTLTEAELRQFRKERDKALLSLNRDKILRYFQKWNMDNYAKLRKLRKDDFWDSVHLAITACNSLPRDFRLKSKQYLLERGLTPLDFGELDDEPQP